jgi:hypothetical protein
LNESSLERPKYIFSPEFLGTGRLMVGIFPPFFGSALTVAQKAELLMNRKKNRAKERGVEIFLIFIKFPFDKKYRQWRSKIYTWGVAPSFKKER